MPEFERREYDRQMGALSAEVAELKCTVQGLVDKVDSLIAVRNQAIGAMAVLGFIGAAVAWAVGVGAGWFQK